MAATFAAGALVPFATWLLLLPALGAWGFYRGATMLRPVAVLVLASAAGGVVAGGALGGGRWRVAFGAAFGATLWIPLLILSSLPALSGGERLIDLLARLTPGLALSHLLPGALGLLLGGSGWRRACLGALVFGAAGAAGGVLLAVAVRLAPGATGAAAFAVSALGGGAACLLPLTLGGWWLGRRRPGSARRARRRPERDS